MTKLALHLSYSLVGDASSPLRLVGGREVPQAPNERRPSSLIKKGGGEPRSTLSIPKWFDAPPPSAWWGPVQYVVR